MREKSRREFLVDAAQLVCAGVGASAALGAARGPARGEPEPADAAPADAAPAASDSRAGPATPDAAAVSSRPVRMAGFTPLPPLRRAL
jgi:hypothetical protein